MNYSFEELKNSFNHDRIHDLIERFGQIGKDDAGGVSRLAFSDADLAARQAFIELVANELHLTVRMDTAGNMFARREGRHPEWPVIMTGSHLDSVRNGGKFDGPAGVFSAFEAFRVLDLMGIETEHPFELAVIASEEPNPFGISTFGSRAMAGLLDEYQLANLKDETGRSFGAALAHIGGDLKRIGEAARKSDEIRFFLELHIEQMPYLHKEGKDIGVVSGITGIYRETLTIKGEASHSGTMPMAKRRDALCGAAEIILGLEGAARRESGAAVATVGRLNLFPNAINITPEVVDFDFEVRSFDMQSIKRIIAAIDREIENTRGKRGLRIDRKVTYDTPPVRFAPEVIAAIEHAANRLGLSRKALTSMAGHDAAHMNHLAATGMIFVPCKDGLSHCPEEYTPTGNIVKGAQCLLETLLVLDRLPGILNRILEENA